GAVASTIERRSCAGRLIAMKRRTVLPIRDLEGEVGEAVLGGDGQRARTERRITQRRGIPLEREDGERAARFHPATEAQRSQRLAQRLRAQPVPTPPSTLSDPDRKPP